MPIYHSVTELIGRTPLLELCNYERNHDLRPCCWPSWSA